MQHYNMKESQRELTSYGIVICHGEVWRSQRVNADSPYRTVPYRTVLTVIVPDKSEKDTHLDRAKDKDIDRDREAKIEGERESVCF